MTVKQLDATQIVADTLISITQVISQSLSVQQSLQVDCTNKAPCVVCLQLQAANPLVQCDVLCQCNVSDVDLSQSVTCDFKAIQETTVDVFQSTFMNNLYLASLTGGVNISNLDVNQSVLTTNVTNVFTQLRSDNFQSSIEAVSLNQDVRLIGPGSITALSMQQITSVVMSSLQQLTSVSEVLNQLQTTLIAISSQTTMSAINQVIAIFLMIITVVIVLAITVFTCQNILSLLGNL